MKRFVPGTIDYNGVMATHYPTGRALSARAADTWRVVLEPFISTARRLTILDLGSGSGRFSTLLSVAFGARVIGVEPAHAMRTLAAGTQHPPEVAFVAGTADRVPLRAGSCDVAWLSQVLHHIRDHTTCARELHRVVRASGIVLIRGTFADGQDGFPTLLRFFPAVTQIFSDLPTIQATIAAFTAEGFTLETRRRVAQQICVGLREFAERTRLRADTSLALLSDEEFASCQALLECVAAEETDPVPIVETLDLLVLRSA